VLCHALLKYECGKLTATAAAAAFAAPATTVSQKNLQLIFTITSENVDQFHIFFAVIFRNQLWRKLELKHLFKFVAVLRCEK